jgi:hypothetical protein
MFQTTTRKPKEHNKRATTTRKPMEHKKIATTQENQWNITK